METPNLPLSLFEEDFKVVYEPAEDTFILMDALELHLQQIKGNTTICLEIGSGSGLVITGLSRELSRQSLLIATDINIRACQTTKKCAYHNEQRNIEIVRSDFAAPLIDRLESQVDLLVFNPPYVPTDEDETINRRDEQIKLSWAGGDRGRASIDVFLKTYVPRLLSRNGVAYMVALDKNNIEELLNYLVSSHRIRGAVVIKRKAGIEYLHVIKYTRMK